MRFIPSVVLSLLSSAFLQQEFTAHALFACPRDHHDEDACPRRFLFTRRPMCCDQEDRCTLFTRQALRRGCSCGSCKVQTSSSKCCEWTGPEAWDCASEAIILSDPMASFSADQQCNDANNGNSCKWAYSDASCCEIEVSAEGATGSISGEVVFFNGGESLPSGEYSVKYKDGCMKWGTKHFWTVNGHEEDTRWWVVGANSGVQIKKLPGSVVSARVEPDGGHESFESCVATNLQLDEVTFTHPGGKLGIWAQDNRYEDNGGGLDGRNPSWTLRRRVC
jgi:hypothetical protein